MVEMYSASMQIDIENVAFCTIENTGCTDWYQPYWPVFWDTSESMLTDLNCKKENTSSP